MTTIDPLPNTQRARQLRRASVLIAGNAEPGPTRAAVLDKLALLIADLEAPSRECRSCGVAFVVGRDELAFYRTRGLSMPTHCRRCRGLRRQERTSADA
jgi:hypothetical protein